MMCKQFKCEGGWLPTDGERDEIWLEEDGVQYEYLRLLIPTTWTPCVCSPLHSFNPGLMIDPLDIWRIAPDGGARLPLITNDSHFYQFSY